MVAAASLPAVLRLSSHSCTPVPTGNALFRSRYDGRDNDGPRSAFARPRPIVQNGRPSAARMPRSRPVFPRIFEKFLMQTPQRRQLANAIRVLSMDAVQKANSGHPGMPMGMADIAEILWNEFLLHNPNNPNWPNRDRFVLSNCHGSMLLYSILHLTGYDLTIEDLKQFRQLHANTPGHPECGEEPGVETSTDALGQGLSNAVGFAIAEKQLASQFIRQNFPTKYHFTY